MRDIAKKLKTLSTSTQFFHTSKIQQGYKGLVMPPTHRKTCHPRDKHFRWGTITKTPPPTTHRFLNAWNATKLQTDCALTYVGHTKYLPTSLCQALLQVYITPIPHPDAPTRLSPLLTPQGIESTRKSAATCDVNSVSSGDGAGLPDKVRSGIDHGPEVPHHQLDTGYQTQNLELCAGGGRLTGTIDSAGK